MSLEAPIPVILRAPFDVEGQQHTPSPSLRAPIYTASPPRATASSAAGASSDMDPPSAQSSSSGHTSPLATASTSVGSPFTEASEGGLSASLLAADPTTDVDQQILEALKSKDRLFVLKLGEIMEGLIMERQTRADVHPTSSYQRLLVHRCAAYYKCMPENDPHSKALHLSTTSESKIPARRLSELVLFDTVAQPAFKIMRRASRERMKVRGSSTAGSVAGEDADLSDVEPSESGSIYSRTGTKKRPTIEERTAAYEQARSRIFMDFQEKERAKEKDMSATSSAVSGSASTSGDRSSVGDFDADSVTTESEWSAPASRDSHKRPVDVQSQIPQHSQGRKSRSTRAPRATSPSSFSYASIYEPPGPSYEQGYSPGVPPTHGYPPYGYPYAPQPGQGPAVYMPAAPYPYYGPYYPPLAGGTPGSEGGSPPTAEAYGHPPPMQPMYQHGYGPWAPPPADPAAPMQHPASPPQYPASPSQYSAPPSQYPASPSQYPIPHPPPPNAALTPSGPPGTVPYAPFPPGYMTPAPYGHYAYYPAPGQTMPPPPVPPHMSGHSPFPADQARPFDGSGPSTPASAHSRASSRNSSTSRRGAPPVRSAWSYGSGTGHYSNDVVGPRLATGMRRLSGASSVGSASAGNRTPGDDASSTVSSSTSSSSARTFTSTSTSSKHPLPARPDWAIGLSPASRHENNSRGRNGSAQRQSPSSLQSTDFPPLSTAAAPPRAPVAGAWTNSSSTRQILTSAPGVAWPAKASAPPAGQAQAPHEDKAYERPPPKANAELFNPKNLAKRPQVGGHKSNGSQPDAALVMNGGGPDAALADAAAALRLDEGRDGKAEWA